MPCECKCQCSCHHKDIPFSEMSKADQAKLKREAGYGLSRKLLGKESLAHREKLDHSLSLDESRRRQTQRAFEAFNDSFGKG